MVEPVHVACSTLKILILYTAFCRCGADLVTLFYSPAVQIFLNGVRARTLLSHKNIYQPGAVRKVQAVSLSL